MDQADRVGTAHEQNGMPLAWGAVVRRGLGLGYGEGRRAAQGRGRGYGHGLAALPAGVSPVIPPWAWYRIALGTSRATEEGGGEKEEDARRTFEAGPERPLGVLEDTTCRHASREALAGSCVRPLRQAAAPRSSGRSPQDAPHDPPQELRSPRSLRGKQRKRAWPRASRRPTWRQTTVAM